MNEEAILTDIVSQFPGAAGTINHQYGVYPSAVQLWGEAYKTIPGHTFMKSQRRVPNEAGIYAVFIKGGDRLLEALGYFEMGGAAPCAINEEFHHLYTGKSGGLQGRMKNHLLGDTRVSNLRKTLLAAEAGADAISATGASLPSAPSREIALNLWLAINAIVAYRRCDDIGQAEDQILRDTPSPLNIVGRRADRFPRRLLALLSRYDQRDVLKCCRDPSPQFERRLDVRFENYHGERI